MKLYSFHQFLSTINKPNSNFHHTKSSKLIISPPKCLFQSAPKLPHKTSPLKPTKITRKPIKIPTKLKTLESKQTLESLPDAIPRWFLIAGASFGVAFLLSGQKEAMALGPEGPLMEEFWDNMRRYGLYALTVGTGVLYAVVEPIIELLKNPITAVLIVIVLAGSVFLLSQILNAMAGNSDFTYNYG